MSNNVIPADKFAKKLRERQYMELLDNVAKGIPAPTQKDNPADIVKIHTKNPVDLELDFNYLYYALHELEKDMDEMTTLDDEEILLDYLERTGKDTITIEEMELLFPTEDDDDE